VLVLVAERLIDRFFTRFVLERKQQLTLRAAGLGRTGNSLRHLWPSQSVANHFGPGWRGPYSGSERLYRFLSGMVCADGAQRKLVEVCQILLIVGEMTQRRKSSLGLRIASALW
jgi:hypothetical protein